MTAPARKRPYKPEPSATNAPRQARLRERRKVEGWRRITVWLSPEQARRLETLGGDAWLGRTVKTLLGAALREPAPPVSDTTGDFSGTAKKGVGEFSDTIKNTKAAFMPPDDKAALMAEVDRLLSQGLSGNDIARCFNDTGRRTVRGSRFVGQILLRDWRKWKGEA